MYYKVKITKNPKAKTGMQVQGSLYNDDTSFGGFNMQHGKKNLIESKYITAVPKEEANLEAEGGETVYGDLNGDTFPEHKIIKGPRHSKGGVPLKLPDDSFIFSDTNSMKINDPNILQMFNQPDRKGKGVTPATLAKQYDIDSYRKILQDPNSDKIAVRTAELMIRNYNMKLGALALAQESKKGFPQGIPEMAKPYMEYAGIDEAKLLPPQLPEPQAPQQQMQPQQMQQQMPQEQMSQQQMPPQDMQQMEQPFPDQMSRFGGQRRLRRAQEGMQQPSPEEMAMMEQQQAQQQPQQGQGGDQMQQIMQQVGQALQQGAQPEEVAAQLIQSQIPPEQVAQIFVQLGMPEQQVQQLIAGIMQQMQGGQEQQMDPRQQQQQISEEEMMAMQQQDPQQMQQAPMAMYGMQMGGYNMPFSNPSYSYAEGGEPCPPCPDGTVPVRTETGDCPCSDSPENLDFYKFALKERDYVIANPGMWQGDPDMTNEDGSYKFCVDCLNKDYNDPNVVKSVAALINNGIANYPHYDLPDFTKGLEKFKIPAPVYQSAMQKKRGGSTNSNMNSMAQYGMQMGGYNMPFAQDGLDFEEGRRMAGDPNIPWQADYNRNINASYSPRPPQIRNTTTNWIHPNLPDSEVTPYTQWADMHENPEKYKNVELSPEELNIMNEQLPIEPTKIPQQQYGGYPMAEYGMEMGGYAMPDYMAYGGSPSYSYARGGSIPRYTGGGEPPKGQIVKRSDYANDATGDAGYQIALRKAKLKADKSGEKIYTLKADGTYVEMKVSDKKAGPYAGDKKGWSGNDEVAAKYLAMETALNDPATAKLFADATRKALLNKEAYKGKNKTYGALYETRGFGKVADLKDEDIVKNYLEHQKRNLQLSASGNESFLYNDSNGKLRKKTGSGKGDAMGFVEIMKTLKKADGTAYTDAEIDAKYKDMLANAPTLDKAFENLGIPMPAIAKGSASEKKALLQQATFQGYDQLMKDVKSGVITNEDDLVRLMNFRGNLQRGYNDESGQGVTDISPIDAFYTNTTAGQISSYGDYQFDEIPGEKPKEGPCQCETDKLADGTPDPSYRAKDANGNCPCTPEIPEDEIEMPPPPQPAEWWLQDTIKTAGAASDLMGVKKYMPWAPKIDLEEPRPTFLDPTRELAQQSEQANMAIQGLSQFAGPQGLSARASSIQGTGAKQAADTLSKYNNANVNLADQFEFKSVDIRNQEAIGNQASQSKMYDQNTMANQQYDNSKLALKNNLRNQYTNAITNKTKTAALNELYPQYNISPATGGMPGFGYGKKLKPETTKTANDYYEEMMADDPDADQNITWKRAQSRAGTQTSNSNQLDIIDEQYSLGKKYGGNMKNGGFIYTTAFPWLL